MKDTTIAVDLAKNVFEIAISGEAGKVSKRLRVSRPKLVSFFAKQSAATVLLESCGSAHFWARTFRRLGHDIVLLVWSKYSNAQRVRSLHVSRIDADIEGREALCANIFETIRSLKLVSRAEEDHR